MFDFEGMAKLMGEFGRIKDALRNVRLEVSEGPVSLTVNGLQEVVRVKVDGKSVSSVSALESKIAGCFNKAVAESRRAAKEEVERTTGWSIPEIPGLF
ncbi:MAG: YbaB/EbfC family nucleoid-associated protein [Bacillota bacterium]